MVFPYYRRLTLNQKKIYRQSDSVSSVQLSAPEEFSLLLGSLQKTLSSGERFKTEKICQKFVERLTRRLGVSPVRVRVLSKRPSKNWGELHGLYEAPEGGGETRITVWMRTAQRKQIVAFKTFLRTLLHEVCHHLDYRLLRLEDSFHTEGFYKRESSLLHPLLGSIGIFPATRKESRKAGSSGGVSRLE